MGSPDLKTTRTTARDYRRSLQPALRSAFSPRDVLFVLFRHKRKALLVFVAISALTVAAALALPDEYRSEAKMLVRLGRESVAMDPTASIGPTVQPIQTRESELNSELEILRSRELVEQVVARLGAERLVSDAEAGMDPAELDADAVKQLQEDVHVSVVPDSNVLDVAYVAADPALAHRVVDAYVKEFLDLRLTVYRSPGSQHFFAEQHRMAREELEQVQRQIRDLKDKTGLADLVTQRTIRLNRIGGLESAIDDTHARLAAAEATVDQLRDRLAELPEEVVTSQTTNAPNSSVEMLRQRLAELRLEEQDLASRYVESSPTVQAIRRQITEATAMLQAAEERSQKTTGLNSTWEALKLRMETELANVAAERAMLERLAADLAQARSGVALLNQAQIQIQQLERQAAIAEEKVQKYARTYEQARIDRALEADKISNISVYQPATRPQDPQGPRRTLLIAVGLFLGVVGSAGTALLAEGLDHTVKRPQDLRLAGVRPDAVVSVPQLTSNFITQPFRGQLRQLRKGLGHLLVRRRPHGVRSSPAQLFSVPAALLRGIGRPLLALGNMVFTPVARLGSLPIRSLRLQLRKGSLPGMAVQPVEGIVLEREEDLSLSLPEPEDRPLRAISADEQALQDLDHDEFPTIEPKAEPDRRFFRTLRLIGYGIRRDLQIWWKRDTRPNLHLCDRRNRTFATEIMEASARDVLESVLVETQINPGDAAPESIAVIAVRPNSGSTTIANHLAAVLAERVRDEAGEEEGPDGRTPVLLLQLSDLVRPVGDQAISSLPARPTPVPGLMRIELPMLQTHVVRKLLERSLREYRHVVLDLSSIFADVRARRFGEIREEAGTRLAGLCEASVVVIEADGLRREAAAQALHHLDRAQARCGAVVLNKRRYPIPQWIYSRA